MRTVPVLDITSKLESQSSYLIPLALFAPDAIGTYSCWLIPPLRPPAFLFPAFHGRALLPPLLSLSLAPGPLADGSFSILRL